jgi:hypothetical protein
MKEVWGAGESGAGSLRAAMSPVNGITSMRTVWVSLGRPSERMTIVNEEAIKFANNCHFAANRHLAQTLRW